MKKIFRFFCLILLFLLICSPCYAGVDFNDLVLPVDTIQTNDTNYGIDAYTVSFWAYRESITWAYLFDCRNSGTGYLYFDPNAGTLVFSSGGTIYIDNVATNVLPADSWHHVLVKDITLNIQILSIGSKGGNIEAWDGKITEFAIGDNTLTADEITLMSKSRLKGMPLQIQPTALKLYLPLDDYSAGVSINTLTFNDLSGNGIIATGTDADGDSFTTAEILNYPPAIGQFN